MITINEYGWLNDNNNDYNYKDDNQQFSGEHGWRPRAEGTLLCGHLPPCHALEQKVQQTILYWFYPNIKLLTIKLLNYYMNY